MAALSKQNLSFQDIYYHIYGSFSVSNIRASDLHSIELINTNSTNRPNSSEPHSMSEFDGYDHNAGPALTLFYGTTFSGKGEVCGNDAETKYWHDGSSSSPSVGDLVYTDEEGTTELEEGWVGLSTTGGFQYIEKEGVKTLYLCRRK